MNNKGFSLIELIAVIALLVVLSLIIIPSVMVFVNRNKENSYIEMLNSIESAANVYVTENRYSDFVLNSNTLQLDLKTLIEDGNLSDNLKDPITGKTVNVSNSKVNIVFTNKIYNYKLEGDICDKDDYSWLDSKNEIQYIKYCNS